MNTPHVSEEILKQTIATFFSSNDSTSTINQLGSLTAQSVQKEIETIEQNAKVLKKQFIHYLKPNKKETLVNYIQSEIRKSIDIYQSYKEKLSEDQKLPKELSQRDLLGFLEKSSIVFLLVECLSSPDGNPCLPIKVKEGRDLSFFYYLSAIIMNIVDSGLQRLSKVTFVRKIVEQGIRQRISKISKQDPKAIKSVLMNLGKLTAMVLDQLGYTFSQEAGNNIRVLSNGSPSLESLPEGNNSIQSENESKKNGLSQIVWGGGIGLVAMIAGIGMAVGGLVFGFPLLVGCIGIGVAIVGSLAVGLSVMIVKKIGAKHLAFNQEQPPQTNPQNSSNKIENIENHEEKQTNCSRNHSLSEETDNQNDPSVTQNEVKELQKSQKKNKKQLSIKKKIINWVNSFFKKEDSSTDLFFIETGEEDHSENIDKEKGLTNKSLDDQPVNEGESEKVALKVEGEKQRDNPFKYKYIREFFLIRQSKRKDKKEVAVSRYFHEVPKSVPV